MTEKGCKKWWNTAMLTALPVGLVMVGLNSMFYDKMSDFAHGFVLGAALVLIVISVIYQIWNMGKGRNPYKKYNDN